MLYVSTRNSSDTYTAHRALHEDYAPDGGFFVPFRLPVFSSGELNELKSLTPGENICRILNLFFGAHLNPSDIELVLECASFQIHTFQQNHSFFEAWDTSEGSFDSIENKLYRLMSGVNKLPFGWAYVAIEIAVLFGVYSVVAKEARSFDLALPVGDFQSVSAAIFAKKMGLPINLIICACDENDVVWDMVNKGTFTTNLITDKPSCFELFLHNFAGLSGVLQYQNSIGKGVFQLDEQFHNNIKDCIYPAVISAERTESIISGTLRSNQYTIDHHAAYAYGGLQDYRASMGINRYTLILTKNRP